MSTAFVESTAYRVDRRGFFEDAADRERTLGTAFLAEPAVLEARDGDTQFETVRRFPFTRTVLFVHRLSLLRRARAEAERRAAASAARDGRRTTRIWPDRTWLPLMPLIARSWATDTPVRRETLASDSPGRTRTRRDTSAPEAPP